MKGLVWPLGVDEIYGREASVDDKDCSDQGVKDEIKMHWKN